MARGECLDRLVRVSPRHTERALLEYLCRCNQQRPRRGIDLGVPVTAHPSDVSLSLRVECRDILGNLIHECYQAAA